MDPAIRPTPGELQRLTNPAYGPALFVAHDAEHVERQLVLVFFRWERHRRARHDDRERDVVAVAASRKYPALHHDRQIGRGHSGKELVLQLRFAVVSVRVGKVAVGVVAGSRLDLQAGFANLHLNAAEASILGEISARVAQQVVRRHVALDSRKGLAEVVRIQERAAARVRGQRRERILRGVQVGELLGNARAGKELCAAPAGLGCVAARARSPAAPEHLRDKSTRATGRPR